MKRGDSRGGGFDLLNRRAFDLVRLHTIGLSASTQRRKSRQLGLTCGDDELPAPFEGHAKLPAMLLDLLLSPNAVARLGGARGVDQSRVQDS